MIKKAKEFIANIAFMFRYSWKIGKSGVLFLIIKTVVATVQPFALLIIPKYILDELSGKMRWNVTLFYVILLICVLAFFALCNILIWHFEKTVTNIIQMKNTLLYDDLWLNMDYERLESNDVRNLGINVQNNINAWNFLNDTVCGFISNIVQLAGYTYIITSLHPLMILVIIIITLLLSMLSKKYQKINFEYQPVIARFSRKFNYIFSTLINFSYGKDIRINKASDWLLSRYETETNEYIKKYSENQRKVLTIEILNAAIDMAQLVIVYGYCAYKAIIGSITVGSFTVFIGAITAFASSFTGMIQRCIQTKYLSEYVNMYKAFAKAAGSAETNNNASAVLKSDKHELKFVDVTFKYPNTDNFVLKNVNITIHSGERLSIVGYNGAGKSTFIKLICRLYEPTEGKIFYNGVDISTIDKKEYRELLSVVFQDFQVFSMTLRDNIVLNRSTNENEVVEAIEKSGLTGKVETLEKGLDTQIGRQFDRSGIEFSGGEAQKLACARAYYRNAPIVILDEPTAALDPIAECQLYNRFNTIIGEKTAIYISHRLASVKFCDVIAVFAAGELVEYGTHTELMTFDGVYADMFKKQSEHYITDQGGENSETK